MLTNQFEDIHTYVHVYTHVYTYLEMVYVSAGERGVYFCKQKGQGWSHNKNVSQLQNRSELL